MNFERVGPLESIKKSTKPSLNRNFVTMHSLLPTPSLIKIIKICNFLSIFRISLSLPPKLKKKIHHVVYIQFTSFQGHANEALYLRTIFFYFC